MALGFKSESMALGPEGDVGEAPSVGSALNGNTGARCGLPGTSLAQPASRYRRGIQLSGGGWCILQRRGFPVVGRTRTLMVDKKPQNNATGARNSQMSICGYLGEALPKLF